VAGLQEVGRSIQEHSLPFYGAARHGFLWGQTQDKAGGGTEGAEDPLPHPVHLKKGRRQAEGCAVSGPGGGRPVPLCVCPHPLF
jgi:hypothetical protein